MHFNSLHMQLLRWEPQMTVKGGFAHHSLPRPKSASGQYWHSMAGVLAARTLFLAILVEEQRWKSIWFNGNLKTATFSLPCLFSADQALGNWEN